MKLSLDEIKSQIKDIKFPVRDTEDKAKDMYNTLVSFFENRMSEIENKIEDAGIVKKETSTTGIILGTLGGLIVGAVVALKSPYNDVNIPVKKFRLPVKETKKQANNLYKNLSSFFGETIHNVEDKMEDVGLIEKKNTGPGIFLGVLAGLAVGGVAALLLAKESGENFRNNINENFEKAKDQLFNKKEETLQFAKNETENVKNAAAAQNKDFTNSDFTNNI